MIQQSQLSSGDKENLLSKVDDVVGPDSVNVSEVLKNEFSKKKKSKFPKLKQTKKISMDDVDIA